MHGSIIDSIARADYKVWFYLNARWHCPLLDAILPFFRNQWFWVPLYFFLAIYMPLHYKKKGWLWCAGFIIAFILSDRLSAGLMKPYFHRLRPCHNAELATYIHLIVNCGGSYGFPSSHAANHFSIGLFSAVTLGRTYKWVYPAAILWALLVAYSQVYVGVHFPLDVLVGGIVGSICGIIAGRVFNKYFPLYNNPV